MAKQNFIFLLLMKWLLSKFEAAEKLAEEAEEKYFTVFSYTRLSSFHLSLLMPKVFISRFETAEKLADEAKKAEGRWIEMLKLFK